MKFHVNQTIVIYYWVQRQMIKGDNLFEFSDMIK